MADDKSNFESLDHSLVAGMVMGLGMRYGLNLKPVIDDDGNYTDRFEVCDNALPDNMHVFITVEPPVIDPPVAPMNFGHMFERPRDNG